MDLVTKAFNTFKLPNLSVAFLADASTAKNLELIQNARDPKSGHCLYGVLNHTKTSGGGKVQVYFCFFLLQQHSETL